MKRNQRQNHQPRPAVARSRRVRSSIAALAAIGLVLGACGGDDEGEGSDANTDETADESTVETTSGGSSDATTPSTESEGGSTSAPTESSVDIITVGVATLQEQYADPVMANQGGNLYPIKWSVGEPLARQDLDTSFVPALAESWSVADDNLTWTVNLREGVKMHDGSDFTASDVKTSIDRLDVEDPVFSSYAQFKNQIVSVTVVDDLTVEIVTSDPYANVIFDAPAPIATDYYESVGEEEFRLSPVAAGPFRFDSQVLNDSMTLTRFDEFWDESRLPNFGTLELKIIPEESSRVAALQSGQIDIAQGISPSGAAQLEGADGVELIRIPQASVGVVWFQDLWFPDEPSPLLDVNVRKALLMAIDRQGIADSLYAGFGEVPANLTLPVTLGNDESLEPVAYDPEQAAAMLEEAGAAGMSIDLNTYTSTTAISDVQKLAETIVSYWQAIGIDANLNAVDPATYLPAVRGHEYRGGVILGAPGLLVSDPVNYQIFFSSDGAYSNLNDPAVDEMIASMRSAVDPAEKEAIASEFSRMAYEEQWALPIVSLDAVYAVNENIAEWQTMDGNPYAGPFWYLRAS